MRDRRYLDEKLGWFEEEDLELSSFQVGWRSAKFIFSFKIIF